MTQINPTRLTSGKWHNVPLSLPGAPGNSDAIMHCFVRRSRKPGPTIFITAAMHGDELNGLEIIRRFMRVPLVLNSELREGSLRESAGQNNIPVIVYEAGEALRLDEISIKAGTQGIINVMMHLGMLNGTPKIRKEQAIADNSYWERASDSGVFQCLVKPGTYIQKEQVLARIMNPSTMEASEVRASRAGVLVGLTQLALVYEGDALFHIARYRGMHEDVAQQVERFHEELGPEYGT